MRKKSIRKGLALGLAMMLAMPVQPAFADIPDDAIAAETTTQEQTEKAANDQEQAEAEKTSGQDSEANFGKDTEKDTNQSSEKDSDQDSKEDTKEDSEKNVDQDTKEDKKQDSEMNADNGSKEDADRDSEAENGADSKKEAEKDSDQVSGKDDKSEDTEAEEKTNKSDSLEEKSEAKEDEKKPETKDSDKSSDNDLNKNSAKDSAADSKKEDTEEESDEELLDDVELATSSNAKLLYDEVIYNTGDFEVHVVDQAVFEEEEVGDVYFETDGSYTIAIPESNPFFPYEVQFIHDGKKEEAWFMDPDDSVEVDGHTFYVSAYFDDTVLTQMNLEIGGETVPVFPKEKKFTNDGDEAMPASLLPLEKRDLEVDLTGYSPLELSMVKTGAVFAGSEALENTDKIIWKYKYDDSYTITGQDGYFDFSYNTDTSYQSYEMIVGKVDQLEASNIRYNVGIEITPSDEWLSAEALKVEKKDKDQKQIPVSVTECEYYSFGEEIKEIYIELDDDVEDENYTFGYTLIFDESAFENSNVDQIRILKEDGTLYASGQVDNGVAKVTFSNAEAYEMKYWTVEARDASGQLIGKLEFGIQMYGTDSEDENSISLYGTLYDSQTSASVVQHSDYTSSSIPSVSNGILEKVTGTLKAFYPINDTYRLVLNFYNSNSKEELKVVGAYVGSYKTLQEAKKAGSEDLKDTLFNYKEGYVADYSQPVTFTIFAGTDENQVKQVIWYQYQVETGTYVPSSGTDVTFYGLRDDSGQSVNCNVIEWDDDSYADYTYLTIVVDDTADLTAMAPLFYMNDKKLNLYAEGGNAPEISGQSIHDFSNGPVQYTASAENKEASRNYWLQIIKPEEDRLYINSLASEDAKTKEEDGILTSTREMMLDSRHSYVHDILLINMGSTPIEDLDVELDSTTVALDKYWTLTGENDLRGFSGLGDENTWNMAKIRLTRTEDKYEGAISGTLKIKSKNQVLVNFILTGVAGNPSITTKEIPNAVKYVHYGTMIQNSNKYSFNKVTYTLSSGKLPAGMQLMPNGELYGVPTESGTFTITVTMKNSTAGLGSSKRTFTFTVEENSDANVDGATDPEYWLKERVPDISYSNTTDYTMTSVGVFSEWVNLYLDGKELTEGVDFTAESGSTRLTIRSQTLKADGINGIHTLSAEFREAGTNTLKKAAQNYHLSGGRSNPNANNSSSRDDSDKNTNASGLYKDSKRGYMSAQRGIATGSGTGYSHWEQAENGWKLIYADGTTAAGNHIQQEDGTFVDQILWEKINGCWYAFNPNGLLATGWVYDYQLAKWYFVSERSGMISGWCEASLDGYQYYLDPATGAMITGWKKIGDKWYYLNDRVGEKTWIYQEDTDTWVYQMTKVKPWGAMYKGETTPDGYQVDETGAWDGNAMK